MSRPLIAIPLLAACARGERPASTATEPTLTLHAADVSAIVGPFVDGGWARAVEVALITRAGVERHGFGVAQGATAPTADTPFPIGSISKVFTATALAVMIEQKRATLGEPVAKLLPPPVKLSDARITLAQLATHTSGLPRLPDNIALDADDPYANYDVAKLYDYVGRATLAHPPGEAYDYSNLGAGLLGHALALRANTSYAALVHELVAVPLGMGATSAAPSVDVMSRIATGLDGNGEPATPWQFDVLAPAGAIVSTARDMVRFVRASLDVESVSDPVLRAAIAATHAQHATRPGGAIGLGWHIGLSDLPAVRWHNGATDGYYGFVAFDAERHIGVVMLATTGAVMRGDALGVALLRLLRGEPHAFELPATVSVDAMRLDRCVGRYEASPQFAIAVTHDAGAQTLMLQATGQPKLRAWPRAENVFYLRTIDNVTVEFHIAGDRADAMTLHQSGVDVVLKRP
jgi:D-alanyl-D-alanine-carboxypeptidase/D-alanyl-D-alanine-endopeptidase